MSIFFSSWSSLIRILVVGVLAYAALIAVLRISGKRTLSKFNAFDLVVTVALGSTLATVILSRDASLADGVLAFVLLVMLQFLITWTSARSKRVSRLVKAEPRLLLYRGKMLEQALMDERVTWDECIAAVREAGLGRIELAEAVVLETDGTISVMGRPDTDEALTTLASVEGYSAGGNPTPGPPSD